MRVDVKGLYHEVMDLEPYLDLIRQETESEWQQYLHRQRYSRRETISSTRPVLAHSLAWECTENGVFFIRIGAGSIERADNFAQWKSS